MNELLKQYIGKDCILYSFGQQVSGIVTAIEDGWIAVEKDGKTEALRLDMVSRIREYPVNKKGKRKSVVLD